jgi:hypothetical protein
VRCSARRLEGAFAAAPILVGTAALGVAVLPAFAFWGGERAGSTLRAGNPTALAFGAAIMAALVGAVLTLLAPGRRLLGAQLEAAPVPRLTSFVGLSLFSPCVVLALLGLPLALFVAPVAGRETPFVLVRLLGAAAAGGASVEAALAFGRRSLRGLPVVACLALLAVAWRNPVVAPVAVALWIAAAAVRPDERSVRASVRLLACGRFRTTAVRYARRRELRRQAVAACVLAASGAAALRGAGVPHQVAALFGGSTALLGAAVVPVAAPGLDRRGEWLWRSAPWPRSALALLHGLVALTLAATVAATGAGLSLAVAPVAVPFVLPLAVAMPVVLGAALLAGAVVPWRSDRLAEQLGAYAAFGVLLSLLGFALARAAPVIGAEHGPRAAALASAALACCVGAAVSLIGRRA